MKLNDNDLAKHDLEALRECMEIAKRELGLAEQLQSMLAEPRPWAEVAAFACHCVQSRALLLRPRESPPCAPTSDRAAQKLRRKMLEAGASQFHPNPVWALLETTQARREERKAHRRKSKR